MSDPRNEATGSRRAPIPDPVPPNRQNTLAEIASARELLDLAEVELLTPAQDQKPVTRAIDCLFRATAHAIRGISFASANGAADAAVAAVKKQLGKTTPSDAALPFPSNGPYERGA